MLIINTEIIIILRLWFSNKILNFRQEKVCKVIRIILRKFRKLKVLIQKYNKEIMFKKKILLNRIHQNIKTILISTIF